jgi:D-xylulose reductase
MVYTCALHVHVLVLSLYAVLDLPQPYTKPSAEALLETLALLTTAPPSWEYTKTTETSPQGTELVDARKPVVQVNPEGVTRYLTTIISSGLQWIEDDEVKERIWDQASARLSERSGRSAMSTMSRTFQIPTASESFELKIHEPAMTGDDLGLKTWAASYMLAKRLRTFNLVLPHTQDRLQVLELGSGTGLVGLAMAGLGADVVLTDLPSICPNLAYNAQQNREIINLNDGTIRTAMLDWTHPTSCEPLPDADSAEDDAPIPAKFPLILAADSLYSPDHPRMLVDTISVWLSLDDNAKVIIEFPYRDAYLPEIKDFRRRMLELGLEIVEEGEEKGRDDWGPSETSEDQDDEALVTCWWSCWKRQNSKAS